MSRRTRKGKVRLCVHVNSQVRVRVCVRVYNPRLSRCILLSNKCGLFQGVS